MKHQLLGRFDLPTTTLDVSVLLPTVMGEPVLLVTVMDASEHFYDLLTTTLDVSISFTVMGKSELSIGIPMVWSAGLSSIIES